MIIPANKQICRMTVAQRSGHPVGFCFGRLVCLSALLAQSILPFSHGTLRSQVKEVLPSEDRSTSLAFVDSAQEAPEDRSHDHTTCPVCQARSVSKHFAVPSSFAMSLGLEQAKLYHPHSPLVTASLTASQLGPRGPPYQS